MRFWKKKKKIRTKKELVAELRSWSKDPHWEYTMNLLEPHISEEFYRPKGDPLLTQKDYDNIQKAEVHVNNVMVDILRLRKRSPRDFDRERYAELERFLLEAENRIRGARQMCEQLMFDGDPTYSGRPKK